MLLIKCKHKGKEPRHTKTILEKCYKMRVIILWDMKSSYISTIIKAAVLSVSKYKDQFSSVDQSCPTLCDPVNHSTPGLPVHHHLPEFIQTHAHRVCDAIQPSHPRSSPSPPAPNPSQYQSLFQWINSSHEVTKVLELQLQHHSFQRNPRADLLQNGLVRSPCSPRDSLSRVFSNTTVQKHQFFGIQPSSQSNSHIHTWPLEKP